MISWLLCVMFIVQIVNKAVYSHTHLLDNGTIISHARPFHKGSDTEPIKKHQHSNSEYVFFNQLNILFVIAFVVAVLALVAKVYVKTEDHIQKYFSGYVSHKLGRAPPCV
ncbi:hypothetical protein JCM21142_41665 [Saccharicrinis fermentans DSM 9555 = JCM 21142]|uniref:Uncharacterized protein n=2 Tax=Saccharicrinis fermentans TaxID=982 RepID=W7Y4I1_9BACT|nr:hypothetical protein JCM21142_41665 [Saccharicrinis fermentans DSM 9555 = JCM 21142]